MRAKACVPVILLAVAVALGGCIGSFGDDPPATGDRLPDQDGAGTGTGSGGAGTGSGTGSGTGGSGSGGTGGPAPPVTGDAADGLAPPAWQVGLWWRWRVTGDDIDEVRTDVVVEDAGDDWVVRTDSEQATFFDARFDISTLGPQRKSDRAGSQGADRVEFFDWPLEEGKSWTTTWDDRERTITVESVAADRSSFDLVARGPDGDVEVEYTFEPSARWFTHLLYHNDDGSTFELTLQEHGTGYDGIYLTMADPGKVVDETLTTQLGQGGSTREPIAVTEAHDDWWVQLDYAAVPAGAVGIGWSMSDLDGQTVDGQPMFIAQCPCDAGVFEGTLDAAPGDWGWAYGRGVDPGGGYLQVLVFLRDFVEHTLGGGEGG